MRSQRHFGGVVLCAALLQIGCGESSGDAEPGLVTERTTAGDTTFVRVVSGSSWGAPLEAVEEMAIGELDGPEELTFGFISHMVPDATGGLYLFDANVPALRYYDVEGRFVRQIERQGSGPGEYQTALGLGIRRDGRLVLRDPGNGRLNVYNPDGSHADSWPIPAGLFTDQATAIDTLDHTYLKVMLGDPQGNEPWPIGLVRLDARGSIVDTIPPPSIEGAPTEVATGRFLPSKWWSVSRYGQILIGFSDAYRFEIRNTDGTVVRVEKEWTPVALAAEERSEWQALLDWQWEQRREFLTSPMEPVPPEKPAFKGIVPGIDGTIWVHLHVLAEKVEATVDPEPGAPPAITWAEPQVFDAFEADGTYLGQVRIPPRTTVLVFSKTNLWGVRRGHFDEQYAVRLRLDPPGEGSRGL